MMMTSLSLSIYSLINKHAMGNQSSCCEVDGDHCHLVPLFLDVPIGATDRLMAFHRLVSHLSQHFDEHRTAIQGTSLLGVSWCA